MRQPDAAKAALEAYVERVGGEHNEPIETQATDLIADLLHYVETHPNGGREAAEDALSGGQFQWQYEQDNEDE